MTFDLSAPLPQPEEVELARGLAVTVRPLTGLLRCQVDAELATVMDSLRRGASVAGRFGLDAGDVSSLERRLAFGAFARAVINATHTITAWPVGRDGAPAPITEANVAALFDRRPDALAAFLAHVDKEVVEMAREGEPWRPGLEPSSGSLPATAPDASRSAPTAPADSRA